MNSDEELYQRIWAKKSQDELAYVGPGSRADVALKLLGEGERFLDIGCGIGTLCRSVEDRYEYVYGVDISENALEVASKYNININKVNLNVEELPFDDDYFDAITCLDVIEHVFNPISVLGDINRILKNGGLFVISVPNIQYWQHLFSLVIKGRFPKTSDDAEHYDGGHLHYFTYKDMEDILYNSGFTVIKKRGVFGRDSFMGFLSPGIVIKAKKI